MPEKGSQVSFNEIFSQKRSRLEELVKSYGGIMVGHPLPADVESLARLQARHDMGEELSPEDIEQGNKLAAKFKGSFC